MVDIVVNYPVGECTAEWEVRGGLNDPWKSSGSVCLLRSPLCNMILSLILTPSSAAADNSAQPGPMRGRASTASGQSEARG